MLAMSAVLTAGLYSCEYKDLEEEGTIPTSLILNFDFANVDSIPSDYWVAFYPADANAAHANGPFLREINDTVAVINGLPAGIYSVTAWNKFLEHTHVEITSDRSKMYSVANNYFSTSETPIKVLDSIYYNQPIMDTPDFMIHANRENFVLLQNNGENQFLTLKADSMVVTVEYKLGGIKNLGLVRQLRSAMNNVAKYRYLAYDNLTRDTCTIMFDSQFDANAETVYGKFYVFGVEPTELQNLSHKMVMFFWLRGNNIFVPIDITKAFANYDKNNKRFVIDIPDINIDLADYIPQSGNFDVNVNSWEDVEIEVTW